ncbi:NinE family protein [Mixta mediterraneensis]|uniref:NinE family protein n=1 Tax=Mixta mediterraneensis TaxID=2758443 RepID=UPI00187562E0|nr:NinE family protein [Mixta mediterraneensis]MBE5254537.1 NinE family protein [Mixta mediterraneensis]
MRRQISVTYFAMENSIFRPTRRSRNKPRTIPTESEVTTCNYVARLRSAVADRRRISR